MVKEIDSGQQKSRKKMSVNQREDLLIENFVGLQKAMTHLSIKFENLSDNISKLLHIFELSARDYLINKGKLNPEADKDLLNKINSLLEQNKTIANGLVMIEEKVRSKAAEEGASVPQQNLPRPAAPKFNQSPINSPNLPQSYRFKPKPFR